MSIITQGVHPTLSVRREITNPATPVSCRELLLRFISQNGHVPDSGKIRFVGVDDRDVYNTTAPIHFRGQTVIAGRVEPRATELSTVVFFWRRADGAWEPCPGATQFPGLQDPCVTIVGGELIVGGVRSPVELSDGRQGYRMEFYRGRSLGELRRFLVGPDGMKDIRLVELPDARIAVFSRPQGTVGGRGKIGFTIVSSLSELRATHIEAAPLLPGQFLDEEWGGANEIHVLRNGMIGVLGHIACFDDQQNRHYYGMVFALDADGVATPPRIIAQRSLFPSGPAKRSDLADVIFSGGLVRHWDGTATLFAGISDVESAYLQIPDPFVEFEA
ncbi:MAG: DUF1861 family protein [Tepidisphaeraceae bacterium]